MRMSLFLKRMVIHGAIIGRTLVAATAILSFLLTCIPGLLLKMGVIGEVPAELFTPLYEIGFPLVVILVCSQLFADDLHEGIWRWLFSTPLRKEVFYTERVLAGLAICAGCYLGSVALAAAFYGRMPWGEVWIFFAPAMLLGCLSIFATIALKNTFAGIFIPLGYWALELLSKGELSHRWSLFLASFAPQNDMLTANRITFYILSLSLLLAGFLWFRGRTAAGQGRF